MSAPDQTRSQLGNVDVLASGVYTADGRQWTCVFRD